MNNLIKDKITIIIPINSKNKNLNIVINNFKTTYTDSDIIVISQENDDPFMKGQLYNIAFKYVNTEYVLFVDDNIYNLNKINLIKTYEKINHPYLGYKNISQLSLKFNNKIEDFKIESNIDEFKTFMFMKYVDFSNCGGFSNLCFNNEYINKILNYKLYSLKKLNNTIGQIGYSYKNSLYNSNDFSEKIFKLYQDKEIEFYEDGYRQTLFDIIYDYYVKDNIRYIGVSNIRVTNNYKYIDLYNEYLEEINKSKKYFDTIKNQDVGVSICITAYKAKKTIKETLDSVIRQSWFQNHENWEILLGIDACKETLEYIKLIMNNYKNLRVFMMDSNQGTYVTSNTIMKIAKYENLIRFDADDIMCPNLVETLMENANKYDIQRFRLAYIRNKWKTTRNSYGQHFVKKSIFEKYGGYRNWRCAADYDFILRTYKFTKSEYLKEKYLFYYRTDNNLSLTNSNETGMTSEYRQELHNFISNQDYNKEENAKINCITNTYQEIFSDIYEYYPDNYMYLMTLDNEWPNLC